MKASIDDGLGVILCCGETLEVSPYEASTCRNDTHILNQQREKNETIGVVTHQLQAVANVISDWSKIVIAYEPVW